jgi:thiosulfate reductase/polysulfide reductase chain A
MEEFWRWQLDGTGVSLDKLRGKGSVSLTDKPIWFDRMTDLTFKTPSGKIELISSHLKENGFESLKPYERPSRPEPGSFRLVFGRSPVHTHGRTQNNPYLNEIMPENTLWINADQAAQLGIKDKDLVKVTSADNTHSGTIRAYVTRFIHPEVVFMVHGFGRKVPWQTRGYNKGLADYRFETGLLHDYDPVGGANALLECVVKVAKAD